MQGKEPCLPDGKVKEHEGFTQSCKQEQESRPRSTSPITPAPHPATAPLFLLPTAGPSSPALPTVLWDSYNLEVLEDVRSPLSHAPQPRPLHPHQIPQNTLGAHLLTAPQPQPLHPNSNSLEQ